MNHTPLRKRYAYKLTTNVIGLFLNFIVASIVPRALGPVGYGTFSYLSDFFTKTVSFLDMGTSTCFFQKISQRQHEFGLVAFYMRCIGIIGAVVALFVIITHVSSLHILVWPHQQMVFVYMAMIWAVLMFVNQITSKMMDGYGLTVSGEKLQMIIRIIGTLVLVILFGQHLLTLPHYFLYTYGITLIFIVLCVRVIRKNISPTMFTHVELAPETTRTYRKEFFHYSSPLFIMSLIALGGGIFDRWMIQFFYGSTEQGLYGLSYQISQTCIIFTGALTPLLLREFAIAWGESNIEKMRALFRRYIPLFYAITAYFACFIAVESSTLTYIFGGKNFSGASNVLWLMALYPIHQTYGQLSSSVFLATGHTTLYRNIDICSTVIGLILTYLLIAPRGMFGFQLGAIGLALKMLVIQIITVNIYLFFNARLLHLPFLRYVAHQCVCAGTLLVLALVVHYSIADFISNTIVRFMTAGILYSVASITLFVFVPRFAGLTKDDIKTIPSLILKGI